MLTAQPKVNGTLSFCSSYGSLNESGGFVFGGNDTDLQTPYAGEVLEVAERLWKVNYTPFLKHWICFEHLYELEQSEEWDNARVLDTI